MNWESTIFDEDMYGYRKGRYTVELDESSGPLVLSIWKQCPKRNRRKATATGYKWIGIVVFEERRI